MINGPDFFLYLFFSFNRDLDFLLVASLKRVQIAACLSVFIKSELSLDTVFETTAQRYGYKLDETVEPGMIFKLFPGEEVQTLVPNFPTPELLPFVELLCKKIGAALGITWQMVLKTFAGANYSSARTDILEARPVFQAWQNWLIEDALRPLWIWVMEDARLRGELPAGLTDAQMRKVTWQHSGYEWVDPQKEAVAEEVGLRNGWTTLKEICGKRGRDWRAVMRQQAAEKKLREELGLPEPTAVTPPAGEADNEAKEGANAA